jgi:hypothetical protein
VAISAVPFLCSIEAQYLRLIAESGGPIGAISYPAAAISSPSIRPSAGSGCLTENIGLAADSVPPRASASSFTIEAAVILPDYLHAIWTLPEHDADSPCAGA